MFMEMDKLFNAAKKFICDVKIEYAKHLLENGDATQKKRARIYLRTKNKRIREKQWKEISPW